MMLAETCEYVVIREHTLGYLLRGNWVGILASDIHGYDPLEGYMPLTPNMNVRPVTTDDFARFRVSPRGHLLD